MSSGGYTCVSGSFTPEPFPGIPLTNCLINSVDFYFISVCVPGYYVHVMPMEATRCQISGTRVKDVVIHCVDARSGRNPSPGRAANVLCCKIFFQSLNKRS